MKDRGPHKVDKKQCSCSWCLGGRYQDENQRQLFLLSAVLVWWSGDWRGEPPTILIEKQCNCGSGRALFKTRSFEWGEHYWIPLNHHLLSPSGDLGIRLVWHNLSPPHCHFSVWLLKSSSNWTKLSMMGPQLFLGWYQMILGVFRCSQLFSDVLSCFPMFSAVLWCF